MGTWGSSIKSITSIKSKFHENKDWNLLEDKVGTSYNVSSRASSTKTRIETPGPWTWSEPRSHQEQVPRKQGLKRDWRAVGGDGCAHQEQVPRKQGLKLSFLVVHLSAWHASRASSTKTRIETGPQRAERLEELYIKSKFHENKDWNNVPKSSKFMLVDIKSKFHENKDWNIDLRGK